MTFQENLRRYREKAGYTAKEFAVLVGVKYTTYAGYETQGREPKYETLCKIADALHVSTDELLGHDPMIADRYIELAKQTLNKNFVVVKPNGDQMELLFKDALKAVMTRKNFLEMTLDVIDKTEKEIDDYRRICFEINIQKAAVSILKKINPHITDNMGKYGLDENDFKDYDDMITVDALHEKSADNE